MDNDVLKLLLSYLMEKLLDLVIRLLIAYTQRHIWPRLRDWLEVLGQALYYATQIEA